MNGAQQIPIWLVACWLFLGVGLVSGCQPISDSRIGAGDTSSLPVDAWDVHGHVTRGELLELDLPESAPSLRFQLAPLGEDWEIRIVEEVMPDQDYSFVVTPPFHGINSRHLHGWHFRNADNTGPNVAGPGNVNAPQAQRDFCFVLDAASYTRALARFHGERDGNLTLEDIRTGSGTLVITELVLGNLEPGETAWIEFMRFALLVEPQRPCTLFP